MQGFNPCFNGRCKRTVVTTLQEILKESFNPCFNGRCKRTVHVLIGEIKYVMFQSLF